MKYLVIGEAACVLHGYVRATTDVDILIEPTRENAERVLEALSTFGYGFARELTADEILARPITVIGDDPGVDIFLGAWSINYRTALPGASRVDVDGVVVDVSALASSQVVGLAAHRRASVRSWLTSASASLRVSVDTRSSTLVR